MGNNIKLDLFQMISQQVRRMLFYIGYYLYTIQWVPTIYKALW